MSEDFLDKRNVKVNERSVSYQKSDITDIAGENATILEKKELSEILKEELCSANSPELWDRIIEKTGNVLRVKHYAENTFRHYIYWVKRFGSYCNYKDPASIHVYEG